MPVLATTLVLASACLHALWNLLLKRARDLQTASLGILAVSVLLTGAMLLWTPGPVFPAPGALLWALGAGIGEGCYFVLLARALQAAPLGWSYAWMRGLGMLLVWPISVLWLGEPLHPLSALGVAAVCAGLALMGLTAAGRPDPRALRAAAATGVSIAGFTLCYKQALGHGAYPVGLYGVAMLVALPVQLGLLVRTKGCRASALLPSQWGLVLAAGVLCVASFLLYLEALALAGAGAMATLRNSSIVFAMLLSRALGGPSERRSWRQWGGAALVTAGAVALAWP